MGSPTKKRRREMWISVGTALTINEMCDFLRPSAKNVRVLARSRGVCCCLVSLRYEYAHWWIKTASRALVRLITKLKDQSALTHIEYTRGEGLSELGGAGRVMG
jgi:hypothetical protein